MFIINGVREPPSVVCMQMVFLRKVKKDPALQAKFPKSAI